MKITRLKKGLFGLTLSLITMFAIGQFSFANADDGRDIQQGSSSEIGGIGSGRIKISNKGSKNSVKGFNAAAVAPAPKVIVYAAFTSETETSMDGTDLPAYLPVLDKKSAYAYVAFRVTKKTTVDIKWNISGPVAIEHSENGFEDPIDGGPLLPGFWYFAWFKLDSKGLLKGTYAFNATVTPTSSSDSGSDSCQFQIVK